MMTTMKIQQQSNTSPIFSFTGGAVWKCFLKRNNKVEEEEIKSKLFLIFFPLLLFNQEISENLLSHYHQGFEQQDQVPDYGQNIN